MVNGKDISETWERRPDKFDFEIEDVINAQGFDGKPRVMSRAEFEEAVKAANGGNGFIAQRVYSAPDQETLDAYRQQLYDGKWYLDCGAGGALYGQGMYATAGLDGTITKEMSDASGFYSIRFGGWRPVITEEFTLDKSAVIVNYQDIHDEFLREKLKGGKASLIEDIGTYAASKGYDAIIVKGEGVFNTDEAIILNRTKVIFLRED